MSQVSFLVYACQCTFSRLGCLVSDMILPNRIDLYGRTAINASPTTKNCTYDVPRLR